MNQIISFPKECIFCQCKTMDYQLIINRVNPDAEKEYICSNCVGFSLKCKAESDRIDRENAIQQKRQNFILL